MPTVAAVLQGSGLPTLEARALLASALGVTRETLVAHPDRTIDAATAGAFARLATRRAAGEPLAYLLGEREFFGRPFRVTPAVLIPRPETELLVDLLRVRARLVERPRILDLGTGSGCVAVSVALEVPDATVTAVDCSEQALAVARDNAARLGARVAFERSDWYSAVSGTFDFIVANPPYVAEGDPHLDRLGNEPRLALVAADGGLACLRLVITGAGPYLTRQGCVLVEHGYDQGEPVRDLFRRAGFAQVETVRDAANLERVTLGRWTT